MRIDEEMKEKIKRHGINVSETVRRALREEVRKRDRAELVAALERAQPILKKIPNEGWVRAVRESREER